MSFIFISYSRQDQTYVDLLVQALESHRLPVWIDQRINYGSRWPQEIEDHLERCQVFLLVMSPRSKESHWVQCELDRALKRNKPIFPLLLEGDHWLQVGIIQATNVVGNKLPPAGFFEAVRDCFTTGVDTAESLSVQAVAAEQISTSSAPPQAKPTPPQADDLRSEKGVDYTHLRDLLKTGQWQEADKETAYRMLEAVGRKSNDWIRTEELKNFPCEDLRTIDGLWVKYSQGKWGFSVQKRVYVKCGAKLDGKYPGDKIWHEFCQRVGWREGNSWVNYSDLTFDPSISPTGGFPAVVLFGEFVGGFFGVWGFIVSSLASRLVNCSR
jgi:hypothetical protein